jgi:hypothetical protein
LSCTNNRYKDDVYDRIWFPCELSSDSRRLIISLNNDDLDQNEYTLPTIVMSTAVTPVNAGAPLQFHWDADNINDRFYFCLHFTITSNITVNGSEIHIYRKVSTSWEGLFTGATSYQISLPSITLNAFEIYKAKDFSQSETDQDDGIRPS